MRARVSVLSDMEVVLYFALLLGPQAMSDCLLGALQQRARSTHRFGHLLPPDPARALPCRPCACSGPGLALQPSTPVPSLRPGAATSSHCGGGVPTLAPTRAPVTPAGPPPPAPASFGGGVGPRPCPFVPAGPPPATPAQDCDSVRADGPAGPPPPAPAARVWTADNRTYAWVPVDVPPETPAQDCCSAGTSRPAGPPPPAPAGRIGVNLYRPCTRVWDEVPPETPAPAGPPPPAPASCRSSTGRRPCPYVPAGPPPATPVRDPRVVPVWPISAPAAVGARDRGCTELCSPVWSSQDSSASSSGEDSTPRRPTRRRLAW